MVAPLLAKYSARGHFSLSAGHLLSITIQMAEKGSYYALFRLPNQNIQ